MAEQLTDWHCAGRWCARPAKIDEIADHPRQTVDLSLHVAQQLRPPGVLFAPRQCLDASLDGRQRIAYLMGNASREFTEHRQLLHANGASEVFLELAGHGVEGVRNSRNFIAPGLGNLVVEIPQRDRFGAA